jgi:hypothetical protein
MSKPLHWTDAQARKILRDHGAAGQRLGTLLSDPTHGDCVLCLSDEAERDRHGVRAELCSQGRCEPCHTDERSCWPAHREERTQGTFQPVDGPIRRCDPVAPDLARVLVIQEAGRVRVYRDPEVAVCVLDLTRTAGKTLAVPAGYDDLCDRAERTAQPKE